MVAVLLLLRSLSELSSSSVSSKWIELLALLDNSNLTHNGPLDQLKLAKTNEINKTNLAIANLNDTSKDVPINKLILLKYSFVETNSKVQYTAFMNSKNFNPVPIHKGAAE